MSVEQAAVEHVLAEQRLAKLAENALIRQNLAAQTLDPPVPAKIPLDARLKSLKRQKFYDYVAFWIFGLANNFAYVCMLSAAQDIMANHATSDQSSSSKNETIPVCQPTLNRYRDSCSGMPLGSVLLADVVPLFVIKCAWPFIMHRMSFGVQHVFAVVLQVISYLIVAFSDSITTSLIGVVFASLGSGIGEVCYLALASHYSKHIISSWSSGTGGAGIFGALAYAALTEPHLLDLTPQTTLLTMLVVPAVCFVTYFALLTPAATIYPVMKLTQPRTWFVFKVEQKHEQLVSTISQKGSFASTDSSSNESTQDGNYRELRETITSADVAIVVEDRKPKSFKDRCLLMLPTMKYMIPLSLTYFAQYLISQGLSEFTIFDCDHGFGLDIRSQYRWYQVISQFGIFLTRSSVSFFQLPAFLLILLPVFEFINASAFVYDAFSHYIPHLWVSFAMMFLQGLIAGASYVNTLFRIHKSVHPDVREFSLGITAAWNAAGIAGAGVASIPLHSFFCGRYAS